MPPVQVAKFSVREYWSGETVDPGIYIDMETGDVVRVEERDTLPERVEVVHTTRRFRRLTSRETNASY